MTGILSCHDAFPAENFSHERAAEYVAGPAQAAGTVLSGRLEPVAGLVCRRPCGLLLGLILLGQP